MGLSAEKSRDRLCQFKVGDHELALVKRQAKASGDLSKWIRSRVLSGDEASAREPREVAPDLFAGLREWRESLGRLHEHNRRLGILLNQGLHRIHLRTLHTTDVLDVLDAMIAADRETAEKADELRFWLKENLPEDEPRRRRLCRFRVTEDELRELKSRAAGSSGLSAWIRERLGLVEDLPSPEQRRRLDLDLSALSVGLSPVIHEHRRWSANLEQVRRRVDEDGLCSSPGFDDASARLRGSVVETLERLSQARRVLRAGSRAW